MFPRTNKNLVIRASLAVALALAMGCSAQARSSEPAQTKGMMESGMKEQCQEMKEQKQKMKEDVKAQDADLIEQLAEMNRAPKDKKVEQMAVLLTHIVEQRIVMDARKAKMEEEMMKHMMQHMQMGKESLAKCLMMKKMNDMDGKSADQR